MGHPHVIEKNFPMLTKQLDRYPETDLLVYDVYYGERQGIKTYCLKSVCASHPRVTLFSLNGSNSLVRQIEEKSYRDIFNTPIEVDGKQYVVSSMEDSWAYETLFDNTPLKKTYLKRLKDCIEKLPESLII